MQNKQKYLYDCKIETNILVIGKTGCQKTSFVQKMPLNNLFGDLKTVEWVSQIKLFKF